LGVGCGEQALKGQAAGPGQGGVFHGSGSWSHFCRVLPR
jgi:hypothetical protein